MKLNKPIVKKILSIAFFIVFFLTLTNNNYIIEKFDADSLNISNFEYVILIVIRILRFGCIIPLTLISFYLLKDILLIRLLY